MDGFTHLCVMQVHTELCRCADEYLAVDSTGKITLNKDIGTAMNKSALTLEVTARDDSSCCVPGSPALFSTTTVTVQIVGVNTQPTFPQCHSYSASIRENAAINTTVLRVCWTKNFEVCCNRN